MRFCDAFPKLNIEGRYKEIFEHIEVDKVSASSNLGDIHIVITPDRFLNEDILEKMSSFIKYGLFKDKIVNIILESTVKRNIQAEIPTTNINSDTIVLEDRSKQSENNETPSVPLIQRKRTDKKYNKPPKDTTLFYGRNFEDRFISITDIVGEMGDVNIKGRVSDIVTRFLQKSGRTLFSFNITDFSDSISAKMFLNEEELETVNEHIKEGSFIKLTGLTAIDTYESELVISPIRGIKDCEPFGSNNRHDDAPIKRVELHLHTKMSELDAVSSAEDIVKRATDWGMKAIAITDHGNVQSFPEAFHTVTALKKAGKNPPKIIYGVEGYVVDDFEPAVINPQGRTLLDDFVVFDLETTGLSSKNDKIIEIGAVKISNGKIIDRFSTFVDPEIPLPGRIEKLTGITPRMLVNQPHIDDILPDFMRFIQGSALVAHNASFDTSFIKREALFKGYTFEPTIVDTVQLSRMLLPDLAKFKLDNVAKALGVHLSNHHRAVDDAECTAYIFLKLSELLKNNNISYLRDIDSSKERNTELIKKMPMHHIVILAQNEKGRVNLYRLISKSHIDYFNKRPRLPKSLINESREGLLIGSACEAGELYSALLRDESDDKISRIAKFYDYFEIQPLGNNEFMIKDEKYPVSSIEDIKEYNKKIISLGEKYNKPVVATCDVHFLNPEDEIYRRIIFYGMGYEDADNQAPLYLRTTEEMLNEFQYLGEDKAYEIVVENTNKIADMIEEIEPVRRDKYPPVIENSDNILRESCYKKAHDQYGDILPEIVSTRLDKELNSIISNGYSVMYIIAKRLVEKSVSDGYLVGSRGSVGSSFAAYTSGISEVNPLPPHYYCTNCKYSDFDSEEVKAFAGRSGFDMPDRICPVCGKPLKKDGHDIPFETFLGFKGDKEPDIDLNFSGEYQAKAHAYTEELFGQGHTFRAGTVGGIADKTAYGYVKKYYEEHGQIKRKAEINRLLRGCVGVKRTTGQHPGGIVVLPHGEEIYSFTPVQKPANDMSTDTITTHFEYHAIDHNLLKLDILGHQAPTMIRMLQDLSGIDPVMDIPFDSKETMSLFKSTEVLGIKPEDIGGCPLGSLGIPEFGTDFAMQMLLDAKPEGISDLIRIAGLAHGTDVWIGNARDLIMNNIATIQTAICTRDDIMIYLISMGIESSLSFKIMESVRKGKGLTSEWEEEMKAHNVPDWYIDSCKKIQYMFPKAHAAAYVMMSWRIAYCKIFYPLAYYASYFSIMANGFSYELMCQGKEILEKNLHEYKNNLDSLSDKKQDEYRDMRIVQEMLARGFEFLPVDLYKSKATIFVIEDGKIRPPFSSIDGLGEVAARQIEAAAKEKNFISIDDFKNRAKAGKAIVELLEKFNILKDIPESNQLSIFDIMQ